MVSGLPQEGAASVKQVVKEGNGDENEDAGGRSVLRPKRDLPCVMPAHLVVDEQGARHSRHNQCHPSKDDSSPPLSVPGRSVGNTTVVVLAPALPHHHPSMALAVLAGSLRHRSYFEFGYPNKTARWQF